MFQPGDKFDRYVIEALLGQGGMGSVYRAHDTRLERRVALKLLLAPSGEHAPEATARLLREARAAAALEHPNAVGIYDVGEHDGQPYIVMELVTGRTLRHYVGDSSVSWRDKLRWLVDIARALDAAHEAHLVHRDVKPENVVVRADGRVKVLDFGIARRVAGSVDPSAPTESPALSTLTAEGVQVGTPLYMAPEQIRGERVDGRADQFAWGVCAYELLSGRVPWRTNAGALGVVAAVLTDPPPPLGTAAPDVPGPVEEVIRRALSKAAGERFGSMGELVAALEQADADGPAAAPRRGLSRSGAPPPTPPSSPPVRSDRPSARPATATEDLRRYTTQELHEIFGRALEERATDGRYGRDDVVEAARELGIDEAAVASAMRDVRDARDARDDRYGWRWRWREVRRTPEMDGFRRHLAGYAIVNLFLFLLMHSWNRWLLLGWGFALAMHLRKILFPTEKQRKKALAEAERRARAAPRPVDAAVDLLVSRSTERARLRVRVEPTSSGTDALAEEEASLPSEPRARTRRQSP